MRMQLALSAAMLAAAVVAPIHAQTPRSAQVVTTRPYLGIGVKDIDADSARKLNLKEARGVEITNVDENSPAGKAGLKEGDVVLEYNGQQVEGGEQLTRLVRETPIGRNVKIGVWRNGSMQTLSATIEASKAQRVIIANGGEPWVMPNIQIPDMRNFRIPEMENMPGIITTYQSPTIGIIGEAIGNQEQFADFLGVKDGVLVKQVNKNSAAEKAGIKAGDVIVKVEDTHVSASRDITRALREAKGKKSVTVTIVRNKKEMTLPVTIETAGTMGTPVRAELYNFLPVMV